MFDGVLNIPLVGANFSTCWNTPRGSRSDRVNCVIKSEVNLTFSSGENYLEESVKEFVWFRFVESVYYPSRTLIVPFGICLYEIFKQTFYIEIKLFCIIYFKLLSIYCLVFRTCFPKSCWMVTSTDSGNEISVIFFPIGINFTYGVFPKVVISGGMLKSLYFLLTYNFLLTYEKLKSFTQFQMFLLILLKNQSSFFSFGKFSP